MDQMDEGRADTWAKALWVLALVLAVAVPWLGTDAPQDDAYITYRYAEHLVAGDGLVFNVGEEPVEGYTNFLWTVLIAVGMGLGMNPEWLGPALGLVFSVIAAILCGRLAKRLGASPIYAAAAMALLALQPTQRVHAMGGLETSMFTALLLAGILPRVLAQRTARGDRASGIWLAAAALTRPEGVMVFGLLELADAFVARRARVGLATWAQALLTRALPFGLIVGAHVIWRRMTYGDWVPNTFHAKVASDATIQMEGLRYVGDAVLGFGVLLVVAPYLLLSLPLARGARALCLWITTIFCLYVVYVGGDYMPTFRFLLPIFPLWSALACASVSLVGRGDGGAQLARRAGWAFCMVSLASVAYAHSRADYWPGQADRHADLLAVGELLNEVLAPDDWIAATAAGRVPYFARRRCIDMMGLSDRHIAQVEASPEAMGALEGHLKGDGEYVLDRRPEVILFLRLMATPEPLVEKKNWVAVARKQAFSISESQIAQSPRFRAEYACRSLKLQNREGYMNIFVRKGVPVGAPPETKE